MIAGGLTLCGRAPFAPTSEVVLVRSVGLVFEHAVLDLRGGLGPADCTLEDLLWVIAGDGRGEFRLDLRERLPLPYWMGSGCLSSVPPFETSRVCLLGEALLIDDLRGSISSFSGDGARGGVSVGFAL